MNARAAADASGGVRSRVESQSQSHRCVTARRRPVARRILTLLADEVMCEAQHGREGPNRSLSRLQYCHSPLRQSKSPGCASHQYCFHQPIPLFRYAHIARATAARQSCSSSDYDRTDRQRSWKRPWPLLSNLAPRADLILVRPLLSLIGPRTY